MKTKNKFIDIIFHRHLINNLQNLNLQIFPTILIAMVIKKNTNKIIPTISIKFYMLI